jgi:CRISPR-associated endonuclease/helicase Cas3
VKEYGDLLKGLTDPGDLLTYHSLAERELDTDLEDKSNDFFLDTWQSGVIITTFDQFLYALLSPKSRHQMRFHNLADALVVLDEVQTLPCKLWDPLDNALRGLTDLGTTHVLAMTATQPGFLASALELIRDRAGFFRQMRRYRLLLKHRQPLPLAAFIEECQRRLAQEWQGRRVLITLNTRRSARAVRDALDTIKRPEQPLYFLSADVTPRDRLAAIDKIKEGGPCLVVSTQCIEAGVDIDMDRVIRDFAPLDSLIQVAGRCNRNGRAERGTVEIVHLRDEDGRAFSSRIYDKVLLQETRTVLGQVSSVDEEDVLRLAEQYFALLREKKDTGTEVTKAWLDWQEFDPVRHLLRGKKPHQVSFVVIEQDPDLKGKLGRAFAVRDRWDRRREIRKLAAQVAAVTVNVWIPSGQNEDTFAGAHAEKLGWLWLLRSGLYRPGRGLDLEATEEDPGWGETIVM